MSGSQKSKANNSTDVKRMFVLTGTILVIVLALGFSAAREVARDPEIQAQQMHYEENSMNPYMGFAPPAEGGPYVQPHSLVYANLTWRELEPQKGNYDFEAIEEKYRLDHWEAENVKLIFRVVLDYPKQSGEKDVPDWLYEEINRDGTWYESEYGKGFSPNYSNKKLMGYHEKLIQALADRYDGDKGIAFIELGSIGHYGEWHTLQQEGTYIPFPRLPVAEAYVRHYTESFNNKILLMRRPHQIAIDHQMGLYNDMFGDTGHTVDEFWNWVENGYRFWLTDEYNPPMPNFWKQAPVGGELAPTKSWEELFSDDGFSKTLKQLQLTHVSWLGPNAPADSPLTEEYQENIDTLLHTMGYHFRLLEETHPAEIARGEQLEFEMKWQNTGVAPFYYPWPLELSLSDSNGKTVYKEKMEADIRDWLPGTHVIKESIQLPEDIAAGEYTVEVAILDPATEMPGIQLNMEGRNAEGRYEIGKLEIK